MGQTIPPEIDTDKDDERIRAFILGAMTAEEESAFVDELSRNTELRQRASLIARMMKAMTEVGAERDGEIIDAFLSTSETSVARIAQAVRQHNPLSPTATSGERKVELDSHSASLTPRLWRAAGIAASIALLIVAGYRYQDYRYTTCIGQRYADTFVSSGVAHGEQDSLTLVMESLYANVRERRDLAGSIDRLRVLYEASVLDEENAYTDHSFLIGWNLAIAYLEHNDRRAAIAQLHRMKERGFTKPVCAQMVDQLLSEIE